MIKGKQKVARREHFTRGHRKRFFPVKNSQSKSKVRKNSYLKVSRDWEWKQRVNNKYDIRIETQEGMHKLRKDTSFHLEFSGWLPIRHDGDPDARWEGTGEEGEGECADGNIKLMK